MQNVKNLHSNQESAECGQSTFDLSIMKNVENLLLIQVGLYFQMWKIYFRFKYYAECGKFTFDSSIMQMLILRYLLSLGPFFRVSSSAIFAIT